MEETRTKISNCFRTIFSGKFPTGSFLLPSNKPVCLRSHKLNLSGFTIVELLVVISIIAVLATGFIVIMNPALQLKISRDARRKSDLKQIQAALELYRADQSSYPNPSSSNSVAICSGITLAVPCSGGSSVAYLQSVPRDPNTGGHYYYCTSSCTSVNSYRIYTCLENTGDRDARGGPVTGFNCPSNRVYFYVESP